MRQRRLPALVAWIGAAMLLPGLASSAQTPSDVPTSHWASPAVTQALRTGLLKVQTDGKFHGDAKVTQAEVALAMALLGRALVDGAWKSGGKSRAVPDSVARVWQTTNWKAEPVRRYAFAVIVTRFGDYVANGLPRPAPDAKIGKSVAIPAAAVSVAPGSPAFAALTYLVQNRMVQPGSVLLKPSAAPITGGALSRALAEMATGVTDRLTDLGKNADGSTPDDAFHKKPPR